MFDAIISAASGILGSAANAAGQLFVNERNQRFTRHMAGTQYQRSVADMRAAGLNPAVLFGAGGGAPAAAPSGQQQNPADFGSSAKNAHDIYMARQTLRKLDADTAAAQSIAERAAAEAKLAVKEANVINNALDNPITEGALLQSRYGTSVPSQAAALMQAGKAIWGGAATARDVISAAPVMTPEKRMELQHRADYFGEEISPKDVPEPDFAYEHPAKQIGAYIKQRDFSDADNARRRELERELRELRSRQRAAEATTGAGSSAKQKQYREQQRIGIRKPDR